MPHFSPTFWYVSISIEIQKCRCCFLFVSLLFFFLNKFIIPDFIWLQIINLIQATCEKYFLHILERYTLFFSASMTNSLLVECVLFFLFIRQLHNSSTVSFLGFAVSIKCRNVPYNIDFLVEDQYRTTKSEMEKQ